MRSNFLDLERLISALVIVCFEIALLALVCGALLALTTVVLSRAVTIRAGSLPAAVSAAQGKARRILVVAFSLAAADVFVYNAWLMASGLDVREHTLALVSSISVETLRAPAIGVAKLALAVVALVAATRLLHRVRLRVEQGIARQPLFQHHYHSLTSLLGGFDHVLVNVAWMLLVVLACALFAAPESVVDALLIVIRLYLILAIGIMVIRSTAVIVDVLDGVSQRTARDRGWLPHYDRIRRLLPTFRICLEYGLWVALGSTLLLQLGPARPLAAWGPRLIEAIGIFFVGRMVIEVGSLEILQRMLPQEGLEEMDRRRRATMVPLVRSLFTYAVYFGTFLLILSILGFNPMPFLAGAGILGLVVGFGAQSLIGDVVSGFFILFENIYLVGDSVEVAGARGVVEAIEFRTTKIRDAEGRVHIIRNGDMKPVINYSKDYTMAAVVVEVAYDADLRAVFGTLREAGQRLRADNPDVLDDTRVDGITAFGASTLTVRTSTRVKPGRDESVAAALRLMIKETFDRQASGAPRKALIPEALERHETLPAGRGA